MLDNLYYILGKHRFFLGGLLMLFIGSMLILGWYNTKAITELNQPVEVRVIDRFKLRKGDYFIKIYYQGKSFSKRTTAQNFRQLKNSKTLVMLTNKERDQFIFPNELKTHNGLGGGIIFISFALFLMFKGYRSLENDNLRS